MTELLAPAGDFETALAAFDAGADAVYCGLSDFSARAFATNFSIEQLKDLVRYAHSSSTTNYQLTSTNFPRRVYVTFNTVIDEANFEEAIERLSRLEQTGIDAIIVQDLGVARICRKFFPGLTLHASTQLVAHNLEGVLALREIGFTRVVLARELSLAEITQIKQRCGDIELEVFIHGALCYSISGLCLYGAMEKGRSGNRGKCPYCCRQKVKSAECGVRSAGKRSTPTPVLYPFSMKDLRLGEDVRKLADLGVASLKIEGRMKSPLYVATVTRWYRQFLSPVLLVTHEQASPSIVSRAPSRGLHPISVTASDLETVFSRRTTELRFNAANSAHQSSTSTSNFDSSPIDSSSLGHMGTPIGKVKRITRDREGNAWLRFHTMRALEKHDGLQFESLTDEGRHFGFGIQEMRQAISRAPVFEVAAGEDVEVLLPEEPSADTRPSADTKARRSHGGHGGFPVREGDTVYCSMSNAVKRMFPVTSFRSSDYPGFLKVDVEVGIEPSRIYARAQNVEVEIRGTFDAAKNPEKTFASVEKALSKLGGTDYALGELKLVDPEHRFAPMSVMNDLRRNLVEKLDDAREQSRQAKVDEAIDSLTELSSSDTGSEGPARESRAVRKTIKLRPDQTVPAGDWDEIIVAINPETALDSLRALRESSVASCSAEGSPPALRLATPVWTGELDFNRLRTKVKSLIREGFTAWECSDLATLRLLKSCGVADISADWTLYAFNSSALAELAEKGVKRFVASPENCRENLQFLAESGYAFDFLKQQSTPLFISLHEPAGGVDESLAVFRRDGLWITTKRRPRSFEVPASASSRIDLSWDPPPSPSIPKSDFSAPNFDIINGYETSGFDRCPARV